MRRIAATAIIMCGIMATSNSSMAWDDYRNRYEENSSNRLREYNERNLEESRRRREEIQREQQERQERQERDYRNQKFERHNDEYEYN
jgi:hypothetical protein